MIIYTTPGFQKRKDTLFPCEARDGSEQENGISMREAANYCKGRNQEGNAFESVGHQ